MNIIWKVKQRIFRVSSFGQGPISAFSKAKTRLDRCYRHAKLKVSHVIRMLPRNARRPWGEARRAGKTAPGRSSTYQPRLTTALGSHIITSIHHGTERFCSDHGQPPGSLRLQDILSAYFNPIIKIHIPFNAETCPFVIKYTCEYVRLSGQVWCLSHRLMCIH